MTELTPSQAAAVQLAVEWFALPRDRRPQTFRITGEAGTGKSFIAKHIVEALGLRPDEVAAGSFTKKAANVQRGKGFPQADTWHSQIYQTIERGRGRVDSLRDQLAQLRREGADELLVARVERQVKDELAGLRAPSWRLNTASAVRRARLLVCDEGSMVPLDLGDDLASFGVPILEMDDPYQLPPPVGDGYFTMRPAAHLVEVTRQAQGSSVLRLARHARRTGDVPYGRHANETGDSVVDATVTEVVRKSDPARFLEVDQLVVGTNRRRHEANAWMRRVRGIRSSLPVDGERLVCLKNDRDLGLVNKATYLADGPAALLSDPRYCRMTVREEGADDALGREVTAHTRSFLRDPREAMDPWEIREAAMFDYGYALTGHAVQGSQWWSCAISADWPNADSWRQWIYTVLSRAVAWNYVVVP